jgi:hypothetical protein
MMTYEAIYLREMWWQGTLHAKVSFNPLIYSELFYDLQEVGRSVPSLTIDTPSNRYLLVGVVHDSDNDVVAPSARMVTVVLRCERIVTPVPEDLRMWA